MKKRRSVLIKALSALLVCALMTGIVRLAGRLGAAALADGATYYIDPDDGDDSNDGLSELGAFKTPAPICGDRLEPGDSVLFKSGSVCTEPLSLRRVYCTESSHITIGLYGGDERAEISVGDGRTCLEIAECSYIDIRGLSFSSPVNGGRGIFIYCFSYDTHDIVIEDCYFHDISPKNRKWYSGREMASVSVGNMSTYDSKSDRYTGAHVYNVTVDGCEFYNCAYGVVNSGVDPVEKGYVRDHDITVKDCYLHHIRDDGVIIGAVDRMFIINSVFLDTCYATDYYTAPCWMHTCSHCVVDNCEIGDTVNYLDGMSVDFDIATENSTYRNLYSHDNCRFFWAMSSEEKAGRNHDNTVCFCLSVNDNSTAGGGNLQKDKSFKNYKFYNNTVVGIKKHWFNNFEDCRVDNNIFVFEDDGRMGSKNDRPYYSNIYWGANYRLTNIDTSHSFKVDPLFADQAAIDAGTYTADSFKLLSTSPAIGAGVALNEYLASMNDLWGNPVGDKINIGCYQGAGADLEDGSEVYSIYAPHYPTEELSEAEDPVFTEPTTDEPTSDEPSSDLFESEATESSEPESSTEPSQPAGEPADEPASEPTTVVTELLLGDVDLDGRLTAADARLVLRIAVRLEKVGQMIITAADADLDADVTAADARLVLRAAVRLEEYPGMVKYFER